MGLRINQTKTTTAVLSLFLNKESVPMELESQPVSQIDTSALFGVSLCSRHTLKPNLENIIAGAIQGLVVMEGQAGKSWGANTKILRQVCTGTVKPIVECASSSWAMAARTGLGKLDTVQDMGLGVTLGAIKGTSVK